MRCSNPRVWRDVVPSKFLEISTVDGAGLAVCRAEGLNGNNPVIAGGESCRWAKVRALTMLPEVAARTPSSANRSASRSSSDGVRIRRHERLSHGGREADQDARYAEA